MDRTRWSFSFPVGAVVEHFGSERFIHFAPDAVGDEAHAVGKLHERRHKPGRPHAAKAALSLDEKNRAPVAGRGQSRRDAGGSAACDKNVHLVTNGNIALQFDGTHGGSFS